MKVKNISEELRFIHSSVCDLGESNRNNRYCSDLDISWAESTNDEAHFVDHYEERIKNTVEDSLADIIIRTMDLAKDIDLDAHIKLKREYNTFRNDTIGENFVLVDTELLKNYTQWISRNKGGWVLDKMLSFIPEYLKYLKL